MPLSRQSSGSGSLRSGSGSLRSGCGSLASGSLASGSSASIGVGCTVTLAFLPLSGPRRPQPLQLTQSGRTVFSGSVRPREHITFVSRRRPPEPFSLTVTLGDVTAARLSVCCEWRRPPGARLGGAASPLVVLEVTGGAGPCGRCLSDTDRRLQRHRKQVQKLDRRLKRIFLAARVRVPTKNGAVMAAKDAAETTKTTEATKTALTAVQEIEDGSDSGRPASPTPADSNSHTTSHSDSDSDSQTSDSDSEVAEEASSDAEESIATEESDSESESVREVLPA